MLKSYYSGSQGTTMWVLKRRSSQETGLSDQLQKSQHTGRLGAAIPIDRGNRVRTCPAVGKGSSTEGNVPLVWHACEIAGREPNSSAHQDYDEGTQGEKGPEGSVLCQVTS